MGYFVFTGLVDRDTDLDMDGVNTVADHGYQLTHGIANVSRVDGGVDVLQVALFI